MSDALTAAIDEIRRVTAASAEACEGDRWTGHDFTQEQDAHFPGPTDDAIAEILNAVIDGRLIPTDKPAAPSVADAVNEGPHTCRSCCAATWNDSDVCDDCALAAREDKP